MGHRMSIDYNFRYGDKKSDFIAVYDGKKHVLLIESAGVDDAFDGVVLFRDRCVRFHRFQGAFDGFFQGDFGGRAGRGFEGGQLRVDLVDLFLDGCFDCGVILKGVDAVHVGIAGTREARQHAVTVAAELAGARVLRLGYVYDLVGNFRRKRKIVTQLLDKGFLNQLHGNVLRGLTRTTRIIVALQEMRLGPDKGCTAGCTADDAAEPVLAVGGWTAMVCPLGFQLLDA